MQSVSKKLSTDAKNDSQPPRGIPLSPEQATQFNASPEALNDEEKVIGGIAKESNKASLKRRRKARLEPTIPKVESFPRGYPQLAAFVSSDPNFAIYRQYKYLRNRCLLYLQDELAALERKLIKIDEHDEKHNYKNLLSRVRDDSQAFSQRREIVAEIKTKLKEYDDLLFRTRNLLAMNKPTERNRAGYDAFLEGEMHLAAQEEEYIRRNYDLVALGGDLEDSRLNGYVQDMFRLGPEKLWKAIFRSPVQKRLSDDKESHYYDKDRIDMFLRVIMTFIVTFLLMLPIFLLSLLQQAAPFVRDAVILAATLSFAVLIAILTKARRSELFTATAAYCAVLVVFVTSNSLYVSLAGEVATTSQAGNITISYWY